MRILHTSDWHLGRSFHREGMLNHQAAYVDHLLDVVEQMKVDVVTVAGDIYDRALPPVDAVDLADDTFARLATSRAKIVVTSGNHDSAKRLGFGARLIDAAGIYIRTDPARVGEAVLLDDADGPVAFYPLPYLDPDDARLRWGLDSRSHESALSEAMRRVHEDRTQRGLRSVVLAHAFVAGCEPSESERDISVGGVSMVSSSIFAEIDYVALGHLHRPQVLSESVRYSGSPLAYSFSEAGHTKGSWLVDLAATGVKKAEFIPAPVPRALRRLRGTLEELLTSTEHTEAESAWVQATLTDASRPMQAMERLRSRFPHTLVINFETSRDLPEFVSAPSTWTSDHDVTVNFVTQVRGVPPSPQEVDLLRTAVEACCGDPDADPSSAPSPGELLIQSAADLGYCSDDEPLPLLEAGT